MLYLQYPEVLLKKYNNSSRNAKFGINWLKKRMFLSQLDNTQQWEKSLCKQADIYTRV